MPAGAAFSRGVSSKMDVCHTDHTVAHTSSSSSDVDAHVTGDDDDDIPSAKKVCVYIFCDKWAKDRP